MVASSMGSQRSTPPRKSHPAISTAVCLLIIGLTFSSISGCGSSAPVEVVDLNKVLDVLVVVLDEQAGGAKGKATAMGDGKTADKVVEMPAGQEDPAIEKAFEKKFADKLNAAKLMSSPIGIDVNAKGEVIGFIDPNKNNVQSAGEKKLFSIEIDIEGGRLIASDTSGNRRPHRYHSGMSGFLLGTMLGRQSRFYSGARSSLKPNYKGQSMSPTGYHRSALSKARSRASSSGFRSSSSSSRARSGSGGFSFGK